jgi:hypothetical protein
MDGWMDRRTHRRSLSWYGTSLLAPDRWSGRLGVDASLTSSLLYLNRYKFDSILSHGQDVSKATFSLPQNAKSFQDFLSHRICRHMYGVLNVGKKNN